jgi:hypothetical protein
MEMLPFYIIQHTGRSIFELEARDVGAEGWNLCKILMVR